MSEQVIYEPYLRYEVQVPDILSMGGVVTWRRDSGWATEEEAIKAADAVARNNANVRVVDRGEHE